MTMNPMEKETYETTEIEVIVLDEQPRLLNASGEKKSPYYHEGEFN